MYKYIFILDNGIETVYVGDDISSVLIDYFQGRGGLEILNGHMLDSMKILHYNKDGKEFAIGKKTIDQLVNKFVIQNEPLLQQIKCSDMKQTCPEGSNETDPILYEDWCEDIPYQEYIKPDKYFNMCYRLSNIINSFVAGLESEKNDAPLPQWPRDPITQVPVAPERLNQLLEHAKKANIVIPTVFTTFMDAVNAGQFNVDVAMEGQYIGQTDKINPKYMIEFAQPAVDILFPSRRRTEPVSHNMDPQEEQDLQMAMRLQLEQ